MEPRTCACTGHLQNGGRCCMDNFSTGTFRLGPNGEVIPVTIEQPVPLDPGLNWQTLTMPAIDYVKPEPPVVNVHVHIGAEDVDGEESLERRVEMLEARLGEIGL